MVVERMRHWDLQLIKLLKEFGRNVLRETVTIEHNRMFECFSSLSALMCLLWNILAVREKTLDL